MQLLYEEIFRQKIKPESIICVNSNIEINQDIYKELNLSVVKVYTPLECKTFFDIIILEHVFKNTNHTESIIENYKKLLKNDGILMFIETMSMYRSNNYLKKFIIKYINLISGINLKVIYIDDVFSTLRDCELKVIDNYRLFSVNNMLTSKDIFLVSCKPLYT